MTYNIRLNIASDGVNSWPNRKEKVINLIKKINPDAFGVQEALHDQMQDIAKALPAYIYVGVGRDDGKEKGEYTAIFYKKSRLRLVKGDSFWLSETPEIPGSIGWDAALTRMATYGIFTDIKSKQDFLMLTSHFDHIGSTARYNSAETLAQTFSGLGQGATTPTIICGDFNFEPSDNAYQAILNASGGLFKDARPNNITTGTYCGFERGKMDCKIIDYIFHSNDIEIEKFEVLENNDGIYYPSDHLPVVVTFKLRKKG